MKKFDKESLESKSSEELARSRTDLAQLRSELAQSRTVQAAERTYAAWVRTGFTIAGAGWTLGQALRNSEAGNMSLLLGGALIILGLMCFIYAWLGFKRVYDYLKYTFGDDEDKNHPFTMNLITVTILSVTLFGIFVLGFGMLLF
jgi:uncharacterized membrane protein YidH (DUF202 family)